MTTWGFGVSLCLWAPFIRTRSIHTPFLPVFLCYCVKLIIRRTWSLKSCDSSSRPASSWQLISDSHNPPTFSGVGVHYLKFTSAIPFRHMTSGVTVETVGKDSWRVVTTQQSVTIRREPSPLLRPVTDRVYWTWVLSTQVYKWVLANLVLGGSRAMD